MRRIGNYFTDWQITMTNTGTQLVIDEVLTDPSPYFFCASRRLHQFDSRRPAPAACPQPDSPDATA
jgi:hypothetical protein